MPNNEKSLIRVIMNLTSQDIANAETFEKRLRLPSKATAVSAAVDISLSLYELLEKTGGELLVFYPAKPAKTERLILPGQAA